jgi:hypothetical protein
LEPLALGFPGSTIANGALLVPMVPRAAARVATDAPTSRAGQHLRSTTTLSVRTARVAGYEFGSRYAGGDPYRACQAFGLRITWAESAEHMRALTGAPGFTAPNTFVLGRHVNKACLSCIFILLGQSPTETRLTLSHDLGHHVFPACDEEEAIGQ